MQDIRLIQNQSLRQEQTFSAAQIQSLDILMAPVLELQSKINHELETNPILEQEDPSLEPSAETPSGNDEFDEIEANSTSAQEDEKSLLESGKIEAEDLRDEDFGMEGFSSDTSRGVLSTNQINSYSVDEEKRDYFFSSLINHETMEEDLQSQLNFLSLNPKLHELCKAIIGNLNEQGFFKGSLADLAVMSGVGIEDMQKALNVVKSLDPPGIGAKDVKESLILQLEHKGLKDLIFKRLINECFEEIAANHIIQITRKLNITSEQAKDFISEIKKLNPYPYARMSNIDESIFVVPEIRIEKEDGIYVVIFEKQYQPRLKISDKYIEMLYSPDYTGEAKEYIKQKIQSANNIIKSIEQRRDTIRKIAEVIIDSQYDFLEKGSMYLKPLTMKHVADKIGVHETTVSRAVSNKFAKTPQGILALKYFFSAGFQSADGDMISSRGVMEKIRNIIELEDKNSPLSDDDIAKILNEEGIPVARRTVAKYREELGILSSRLRKEID